MVRYVEEMKHDVKYEGVKSEEAYKRASEMVEKTVHGDEEMKRLVLSLWPSYKELKTELKNLRCYHLLVSDAVMNEITNEKAVILFTTFQ